MNLQRIVLKTLLFLGLILTGCNRLIYEDLSECEQGVYVSFYSQTPCVLDSAFVGDVSSLHVFAFNENNQLVTYQIEENVTLDQDYKMLIPVESGVYSFIAWANINNPEFQLPTFTPGSTNKKEVLFSFHSKQEKSMENQKVWQGESSRIYLPTPSSSQGIYKSTSINLRELTNRVTVSIVIDPSIKNRSPKDFSINLSSANGTYLIDGSMPLYTDVINYSSKITYTENSVQAKFTTLDLALGYQNRLVITNNKTEEIVFEGDLIGSILMNTIFQNINLDCENDFYINMKLKDKCADCGTYYACEIFVNGWEVHSYEIEFE